MDENVNISEFLNHISVLYFLGTKFVKDDSSYYGTNVLQDRKVIFTIPEFIDFDPGDLTYDGKSFSTSIEDRIELSKLLSWKSTREIVGYSYRLGMKQSITEPNDIVNEDTINWVMKTMLDDIKNELRYFCKIREGEHWTKEQGEQAAIDYINSMKSVLFNDNTSFTEV